MKASDPFVRCLEEEGIEYQPVASVFPDHRNELDAESPGGLPIDYRENQVLTRKLGKITRNEWGCRGGAWHVPHWMSEG